MNPSWLAAWLPALLLVGLALVAWLQHRTWTAPGAFFAAYWSGAVVLPLIMAPHFSVSSGAVWWIFISAVALHFGSVVGHTVGTTVRPRSAVWLPEMTRPLLLAVVATSVLGFGVVVVHLATAGLSVSVFGSIEALADTARNFAVARYHDEYSGHLLARAFLIPLYLSAPLGGWLASVARSRRERLIALLPFVPALAVVAILTTKAALIGSLCLWIGGGLAGLVVQRRRIRDVVSAKVLAYVALSGFALVAAFVLSFMARYGFSDFSQLGLIWDRMQVYAFGHLSGFSWWTERVAFTPSGLGLGANTFAGLFDAAGLATRQQGIYTEFVDVSHGQKTNIFTFFRGLIEDFSALGALLVLGLVGFGAGYAHKAASRGHLGALGPLAMFYGFTGWSFVVSLFNYNSYVAMAVLLMAFSYWFSLRHRRLARRAQRRMVRPPAPLAGAQ